MSVQVTFQADDNATLAGLVASFAHPAPMLETIMPLFDDLKAKLDDLKATAASEHDQVVAAVQALQDKINSGSAGLTADQLAEINTGFADVKTAIGGVFEPPPTP